MRGRFDWAGACALTLATGLAVGWGGTLLLISGPWDPDPISDAGANLLATIGGAMVGAVAAYLGVQASTRSRQREADRIEDATTLKRGGGS